MPAAIQPSITAIVPVRDEEHVVEACIHSLAAQPEIAEIRVVNDGSTDRTAEILSRLTAKIAQLRVIEAGPLPSGWVGKNHAAWVGAQDATTDWLLFTDADVRHLPGSAAQALANAKLRGAALVSYSPLQLLKRWWERALIPFVFIRLAARYPYASVNDGQSPVAAANGQYLLICRDTYQIIGGHGAVADEVLEDVALARCAKAAGFTLAFSPGPGVAVTRMYRSFSAMWQGWTKNLYPLTGGTATEMMRELVRVLPWEAALVLGVLALVVPAYWPYGLLWFLVPLSEYARGLVRHQYRLRYIIWWGPGLVLYVAALIASASHYSSGSVAWKGRTYPVRP